MKKNRMVIDTHAHFGIEKNKMIEREQQDTTVGKRMLEDIRKLKESVGYSKGVVEEDNDLETYIKIMERNNIEVSWMHQLSFQSELGYEILPNAEIAQAIKKYPNKLKGFASVNPHSDNAVKELENAIKILGLHAFKLNPNDYGGFQLNDRKKLYPLYAKCVELGIPISIHTGITPGRLYRMKNNYPILLDDVAVDFPELVIIVEHMGFPWNDLCYYMVARHPNMYITVTAVANILIHQNPRSFLIELCKMIGMIGSERILWGSDWTATPNIDEVLAHIQSIKVPFIMKKMMKLQPITQKDIDNILYRNAKKILN